MPAQDTNVEGFLKALGDAGGFSFTYGSGIPLEKPVISERKQQSIRKFLDEAFKGDSIRYIEKTNKILLISEKDPPARSNIRQTLRGIVLDKDTRVPLAGANIVIASEGPVQGTITTTEGGFRLENIPIGQHEINTAAKNKRNIPK